MGFDINRPLWLIIIPFILAFLYMFSKNLDIKGRMKKNTILFLRSMLIIFLILSMAGLGVTWTINENSTIFLVDASDSMKGKSALSENFIKEALDNMMDNDSAGIILFGAEAEMESFISKKPIFQGVRSIFKPQYTNIEKAITAAVSVLPDKTRKRIVLISDGEENQGDSSKTVGIIKDNGIDFKVFKTEKEKGKDVAMISVTAPPSLNKNEEFNLVVNLKSNINTSGNLRLFDGDERVSEERVEISKGENRFVFKDKVSSTGFKIYKAIIDAEGDSESRNNEASTLINIKDEPKILLVEGTSGEGEEFEKMLIAFGAQYDKKNVQSVPSSLQSMLEYKTIIFSNVSIENLNSGFQDALEAYVKDFGGGFIVSGGEDSFALGGYQNTSIEKVLPVKMEPKGEKAISDMSIILVIDKSGSMGGGGEAITKMDLAKESAARVLDSLRDNDKIGVLSFDNSMYWVVKPQKLDDRERIRNEIGTIREGGGTSILPPLEEAVKTIKGLDSKIKHVILLTDGQAEKTGYDKVLGDAANSGVTVSTVAVGGDADSNLLEYISEKAGGRFYQTDESSNLPSIFAKETLMATKSYINNREFLPRISSFHPILGDTIREGLPSLFGYMAGSPKDTANVLLESDEGDPILSLWQYGLGKTVAWNSDMTGRWSANYVNWVDNLSLWNNIINYTIEDYEEEDFQVTSKLEDGCLEIQVRQKDGNEEYDTRAIITTPSNETIELDLNLVAPGQYRERIMIDGLGTYLIKIVQSKDGDVKKAVSTGLSVPYSPEYAIDASTDKLDRLILEVGGKYIKEGKEVFQGSLESLINRRDLSSLLLFLSLLLLLLDIALRRLDLPIDRIMRPFGKMMGLLRRKDKNIESNNIPKKPSDSIDKKKEEKIIKEADKVQSEKKKQKEKPKDTLDTSALLKKKHRK